MTHLEIPIMLAVSVLKLPSILCGNIMVTENELTVYDGYIKAILFN